MEDKQDKEYKTNEELLEELITKYGTELKRLAYLYVRDHSVAEDILQEVFVSCYRNLNHFRNDSSYKTWLVKITVNKCKDHFKRWDFRNLVYKAQVEFGLLSDDTSPEQSYFSEVKESLLVQEVFKLPFKLREVIILFYYEELSIEEISTTLEVNVNTIKSRLHRARKKLKESLGGSEAKWKTN
ncbi:sigma-70 family RNA polymerase sigma factor [Mesobacillus sp. LC4]